MRRKLAWIFVRGLHVYNNIFDVVPLLTNKCFVSHRPTDPFFWKSKKKGKKFRITCKEASTLVYKNTILLTTLVLKCQFDQIFQSLCLWIFRKFMQRLLTTPSRFSTRVLEVGFFPRYFSYSVSAINRPCSYRAVRGMGLVTSYS